MADFKVRVEDIQPGEAKDCLIRLYLQYQKAVESESGILMINRQDLATVLAMASLWSQQDPK